MITLGIDTSNYTTSAALFDGTDYLMRRKILDVGQGSRGIRQSEGVFIHNRELGDMLPELLQDTNEKISAVGVSIRPRNVENSYMPVFTVGHGYAKAVSAALGAKLYEFSHQDGHIMAGIYSSNCYSLLDAPFISVHISGGTTEILVSEFTGRSFNNKIIGGTLDISVGQLIDRIGVKLGLKFPCGKELELIANSSENPIKGLPMAVKGSYMNLSGVETKLMRETGVVPADMAKSVILYVRDVLIKAIENAVNETGIKKVLIAGGVASNMTIRIGIESSVDADIFFASRELSSDNAVGVASLAAMAEQMS
jgi:N6-L-threonylcarbamoyladenine synthase